ncbi:MFS transporter [Chimaeribacter arupi]|uniref:MFS transporter n=1 Tax=Chimaeribacter arupi TaxID=2060066 RepID=A0A2N5ESF7_9GAMM|nr:MFS transporter [Chimaeribacter arupi]PLR45342.1 MFS transporter [Chimaeribacter arupi]PLR53045.1 MFS transporter [Chimaeribacter arupi]
MERHGHSGWGALFAPGQRGSALVLSGGVALHATNNLLTTTILPSVVQEIGGLALYAWSTTLFVVTALLGAALSTRLLRWAGPRPAYAVAALFFSLGSLACALAPTMPLLLVGRTVQGLGGGFLFALSYAMVHLMFPPALWTRAMALISAMWGIATLVGPAIGGIFANWHAWRWAFGLMLPLTLLFILGAQWVLPRGNAHRQPPEPLAWRQLALLVLSVLVVAVTGLSSDGRVHLAGVALVAVMLWVLSRIEARSAVRLLPVGALQLSSPLGGLYLAVALLMVGMGFDIYLPYLLQVLHGQSPLLAGYLFAVMSVGWTLGELCSAGLGARGARRAMLAGPLLMTFGIVLLLVWLPAPSAGGMAVLLWLSAGLLATGYGVGVGWPHLLAGILLHAQAGDKDRAGSSITLVQSFTAAMGAALAGMVANAAGINAPGGETGASEAAFWLCLVFIPVPLLALIGIRQATAVNAAEPVVRDTA